MNAKKNLSIPRVLELKQYYISMYRFNMVRLYEAGYINDPTIFNDRIMYKNILDLKIRGLYDVAGKVQLSSKWLYYALCKNKEPEQVSFLQMLFDAVKYREYSNDLDIFYESFGKSISLQTYCVGTNILSRTKAPLNRGTFMMLVSSGKTIKEVTIHEEIWKEAMRELGIPESDWFEDGLFDLDLTHAQEVENLNILLEGKVNLNGKHSDTLLDWFFNHKWSSDTLMANERRDLLGHIYSSSSDEVYNALSTILEQEEDSTIVGIIGDTVYVEKPIEYYNIPVSYFAICSCCDDTLLGEPNAIYGYTGEGYVKEYLDDEEISYVGVPVKVVCNDLNEVMVYDREQVDTPADSWFKVNDAGFIFEEKDILNPFKDEDSLQYELFNIHVKAQEGKLGKIEASKCTVKEIEQAKKKVAKKLKEA